VPDNDLFTEIVCGIACPSDLMVTVTTSGVWLVGMVRGAGIRFISRVEN